MEDFVIENGVLYGYQGESTDVVIPDGVRTIAKRAFYKSGITSVIMPQTVTEIDDEAFFGCDSLCEVYLSPNITIWGKLVFSECNALNEVEIPYGITTLGSNMFKACECLQKVTLPEGIMTVMGFQKCTSLSEINIPLSAKRIGGYAFAGCTALSYIELPEGLEKISSSAFMNCYTLNNITIPQSVLDIGSYAFCSCSGLLEANFLNRNVSCGRDAFRGTHIANLPTSAKLSQGGCYIATAVYGSYDCPQVWTLRRYRDNKLAKTKGGRLFIRIYYKLSPIFVRIFGKTAVVNILCRNRLDKFVESLKEKGYRDTPYSK